MAKWKMQHRDDFITETEPKDLRGLLLAKESGYGWVCVDGKGWRHIDFLIRDANHERVWRYHGIQD